MLYSHIRHSLSHNSYATIFTCFIIRFILFSHLRLFPACITVNIEIFHLTQNLVHRGTSIYRRLKNWTDQEGKGREEDINSIIRAFLIMMLVACYVTLWFRSGNGSSLHRILYGYKCYARIKFETIVNVALPNTHQYNTFFVVDILSQEHQFSPTLRIFMHINLSILNGFLSNIQYNVVIKGHRNKCWHY